MTAVIDHSVVESWWSSGCPMCVSEGLRVEVCFGAQRSPQRGWRSLCRILTALFLLQALATAAAAGTANLPDRMRTCHQDGTGLPLQADWAGGGSSSTGTMTPADHGKKGHILAFAITSD